MKKFVLKLLPVLVAAAFLCAGSSFALQNLREDAGQFYANPDEKYEKVVSRVEKASHSNSFHGTVLIATEEGIILFGGPKAVTTEGKPVDLYTTYNIGSCSKTFTAVAVFQLVEAGRMTLDDPVSLYFPDYETGKDITIRHLLHMQSGIADYVNNPEGFWVNVGKDELDLFMRRTYRDEVTDEEFLENLYAAPLDFAPGTQQDYSNTNYHLLGMIVEQVSGMSLRDYLQEHIFDPCGMEHTTAVIAGNETSVPTVFQDLLAEGMVNEKGYTMAPNYERGAGGVHTCPADLWAFDRALVSHQLVAGSSFEEMTRFEMEYGCGLYPYTKKAYGHSGRDGTYTTQNVIMESEQFGRVYFIASTPTDAGSYGLDAVLNAVISVLGLY
jgi:CubicO group peptidase (beta-lactamase class C family)